jgi:hypothetical protein
MFHSNAPRQSIYQAEPPVAGAGRQALFLCLPTVVSYVYNYA